MSRVLLPILLSLVAGSARADDFTGFYAGLNAGYGWGRDRAETRPGNHVVAGRPDAGAYLPPSAMDAAASIRGAKRAEPDRVLRR
ncbi:hypothetical protein MMSR116_07215 [Methylobacterium mesophilicum SR1.6/6]|uniref:Porin family protein n=1 Tax=Methylobacterium mesophilicum SR1.6/6 TaxID=908290 RepID=A0A6B9FIB3_9HYPH|nr:hypothetical protein [Methylobacterium mesophilicum]QGY01709.1 hypothetical protein MMSR116_07215 [Methylobacterium mesophilicum SR1.6/6]